MQSYSQTNIQLYNQLHSEGYSKKDLICIRKAYELATTLFAGRYLANGKTHITHAVRTASILGCLHASAAVVAAGLIHNTYRNGDFGICAKGIPKAKRRYVESSVGPEVEQYVAGFTSIKWNDQTLPIIRDGLDASSSLHRNVVLLRLADHLEHHLDFGVLYYKDARRRQYFYPMVHVMEEMAEKLGSTPLANELRRVHRENAEAALPLDLLRENSRSKPFQISPHSCSMRLSIIFRQKLVRGFHYVRQSLSCRLRRLFVIMDPKNKVRF